MGEITTRDDYQAVVEKYAARLKVARSKYDDFKKEVDALEQALAAPPPKEAGEAERKDYANLMNSSMVVVKDLRRMINKYDDHFDDWTRSVKLFR